MKIFASQALLTTVALALVSVCFGIVLDRQVLTKKSVDLPYKVIGDEQPGIAGTKDRPDTALVWMESRDTVLIKYSNH